jgi:hypothetical protein
MTRTLTDERLAELDGAAAAAVTEANPQGRFPLVTTSEELRSLIAGYRRARHADALAEALELIEFLLEKNPNIEDVDIGRTVRNIYWPEMQARLTAYRKGEEAGASDEPFVIDDAGNKGWTIP